MRTLLFVVVVAIAAVSAACGKHGYNRDDLTIDLAKHHIDLRWGRLENAAQRVTPELRGPFLTSWATRLSGIELQDVDVQGMVFVDDDTADVVVAVTYVERDTMAVRTVQIPERWLRTDDGWRLSLVSPIEAFGG